MNHHRLGIVPHPGRKIGQRHKSEYRTPPAPPINCWARMWRRHVWRGQQRPRHSEARPVPKKGNQDYSARWSSVRLRSKKLAAHASGDGDQSRA
jgi:hypothetical protein